MVNATAVNRTRGDFDWLAMVIYPLAVILMESFWVYPWLAWVGSWPAFGVSRPVLHLASVIITLLVSLLVTRLALRQKWGLGRIRTAVVVSGLVVILLVLAVDYRNGYVFLSGPWFAYLGHTLRTALSDTRTLVIALPALLYLWWRGTVLGQTTTYFRDIYRTFVLGMVALIVLIIFWQISGSSGRFSKPGADVGWYIMAFFFFGLISIAVCHFYLMRRAMPREEARLTSVWRWLPIMLGVIGIVVLLGFGVASIFSPSLFESIGHGFGTFGSFLGKIGGYIIWPAVFVFEWLVKGFIALLRLLSGNPQTSDNVTGNLTTPQFPEVVPKELAPWVQEAVKWFAVAVIAGLVLFFLAKAVSRMRVRRARDEIEEIHESLLSWKGVKDDFRELFGLLGNRFRRKPAAAGYSFDEDAAGMDIREIYRHVLWEGRRSGMPRRPHETPGEYSGRVTRSVPEGRETLRDITGEYEDVRYGDMTVPPERVARANGLWQALKGMLRRLRGD
jgi:hypothetical protein